MYHQLPIQLGTSQFNYTATFSIIVLEVMAMRGDNVDRKLRILIAKPGLDGHDRGAKVVARALMDAGMEVIYTGLRQTVDSIINSAIQEDIDIIALSILSGAHLSVCERLFKKMKDKGLDIPVVVGGIIPEEDVEELKRMGVKEVFGPGTSIRKIVEELERIASERRKNGG